MRQVQTRREGAGATDPLGNPQLRPYGIRVVLWFELQDFDAAAGRAAASLAFRAQSNT